MPQCVFSLILWGQNPEKNSPSILIQQTKIPDSYSHIWFHAPRISDMMSCSAGRERARLTQSNNYTSFIWQENGGRINLDWLHPVFQICHCGKITGRWKNSLLDTTRGFVDFIWTLKDSGPKAKLASYFLLLEFKYHGLKWTYFRTVWRSCPIHTHTRTHTVLREPQVLWWIMNRCLFISCSGDYTTFTFISFPVWIST